MLFSHLIAFVLALSSHAMACTVTGTDADGDCYENTGPVRDCDDTDPAINPNAQEITGNDVDEDCDKSDALNRVLLVPSFPDGLFAHSGTVTFEGDGSVTVGAVAATWVSQVYRYFSSADSRGQLYAAIDVTALSGGSCYLDVDTAPAGGGATTTAHVTISGTGITVSSALSTPDAPRTIGTVTVRCPAHHSTTVDWITLQNTSAVFPPAKNLSLSWDDLDAPGGGLTPTVVRQNYGGDGLLAASDLGGVAYKDLDGDTGDTGEQDWRTINGTPPDPGDTGSLGALMTQADLGVWDVLDTSWGNLLALTGRLNGATLDGGLWVSNDMGTLWDKVADTWTDGVGGWGKYSGCASGVAYGGGKLLIEEFEADALAPFVYLANADQTASGVWLYDPASTTEIVCPMRTADGDLPEEGYIGALARTTIDSVPVLVVGYRSLGASDAIYLCTLPTDGGEVDIHCDNSTTASCVAVGDSLQLDIRDLEVDPGVPEDVYIAGGSDDPTMGAACDHENQGDIYRMTLMEDGGSVVSDVFTGDLSDGAFSNVLGVDGFWESITGISFDPESNFFYAAVPVTHDKSYVYDRLYRIPYAELVDLGTPPVLADWTPINQDSDSTVRYSTLDLSGSWIDDTTADAVKADPFPAYWAPAEAIDLVWYEDPANIGTYFAVLPTLNNMWQVSGLDSVDAYWDPEDDTSWVFWPEADTAETRTFQTTVVNDIAVDTSGNVWMPVSDLGLFVLPVGDAEGYSESDCLWDAVNAGGARATVAKDDDSVWITMFDQGGGYHQNMGVFRAVPATEETETGLWSWAFQGAGSANYNLRHEIGINNSYECKDHIDTHQAVPMDGTSVTDGGGNVFNSTTGTTLYDPLVPSWGDPVEIQAFSEDAAAVLFQSYAVDSTDHPGRIAYTVDGGATWASVTFNGDWDGEGALAECDEYEFFRRPKGMSLVMRLAPSGSHFTDSGDFAFILLVGSRYEDAESENDEHCGIARVTISDAVPDGQWEWFPTYQGSGETLCKIKERDLRGIVASPWSKEFFTWGFYRFEDSDHFGGVCETDLEDPTISHLIVDPAIHHYSIADVAPNPYVTDVLFVAPILDVSAWEECQEATSGACLTSTDNIPYPFFEERISVGWTPTIPTTDYPPSFSATSLAWTDLDDPAILYGTEGAGAWRGSMSW